MSGAGSRLKAVSPPRAVLPLKAITNLKAVSQLEAVGLALAGYTFWVLADTSFKIAGASNLPAYEVAACVGVATLGILLMRSALTRNLRVLRPIRLVPQLLRSCLDLANTLCVVVALRHLPLALFYILIFFAPLVTTLLEAVFLHERLDWAKSIAISVGFFGVIVAVNPFGLDHPGDWTGYLACLVCVAAFSVNMVWSRVMTQTESPESLTFCSGVLTAAVGGLAMLGHVVPVHARLAGVLTAIGLFGVAGSLCFFAALKHTSAATVSQYHYSQLLTGAVIGYLVWHEKLSVSMLLGAALIIGSGGYTATRVYRSRPDRTGMKPV